LVYARNIDRFSLKRLKGGEEGTEHYNKVDPQGRRYYTKPLRAMGSGEDTREARPTMYFAITAPDGTKVFPKKPDGTDGRWRWGPAKVEKESGRIEWVKGRNGWTPNYRIFADTNAGRPPETIWTHGDVGSNRTAKAEVKALFGEETTFTTPKPEALIRRIFELNTEPGDLVLDSFLGSGTSAAVAHKMGRQWIGIEMGDHARTHCAPRLQKVIQGEQGGISKDLAWKGGGGFRFFKLGPPVFDETGHIRKGIRFDHLAAHIWFAETGVARSSKASKEAFLGEHDGVGYYLLYNGILGDDSRTGGNVLTKGLLRSLPKFSGPRVIYGEACMLDADQLRELDITFRQTPYDIKAR
jgi:adenine-specific DNA-methyltransferase